MPASFVKAALTTPVSYFPLPSKPVKPVLKCATGAGTLVAQQHMRPCTHMLFCGPGGSRTPVRTAYPGTR